MALRRFGPPRAIYSRTFLLDFIAHPKRGFPHSENTFEMQPFGGSRDARDYSFPFRLIEFGCVLRRSFLRWYWGWTKSISHHLGTPLFARKNRVIISFLGFLGGAEFRPSSVRGNFLGSSPEVSGAGCL